MKPATLLLFALVLLTLFNCTPKKKAEAPADLVAYNKEIEGWYQKRVENLKAPNGWLNLIGLYWLEDGPNTFGSGKENKIIFPQGTLPDKAGYFMLKQNTVSLEVLQGVNITYKEKPVKNMIVFHPDSSKAPQLGYESIRWSIIKRDNKFGIRARDLKSPAVENFKGIDRYPVDVTWRLEAVLEKADSNKTIDITNVLGQTTRQKSPGTLVFTVNDKEYRLDALDEGGDELFVIFADSTNSRETYGAGRFIYVPVPDKEGKTIIDFNKAYNPPCAFTEYATCPLPPIQNRLATSITAGEKNYGEHHENNTSTK